MKKKEVKQVNPKFKDPQWIEWRNSIVAMENSQERNEELGNLHDIEECIEVSYHMSLGQILDMEEWCVEQGPIDPPFKLMRIPVTKNKGIPLPYISITFIILFVILTRYGVSAAPLMILGLGFILTLVGMAFTLAKYTFHKAGRCHTCGKVIDDDIDLKVLNSKLEETHHSNSGLCMDCEWNIHRHNDIWLEIYNRRCDTIISKGNKVSWGVWRDPMPGGNGAEYHKEDLKNPYDREDLVFFQRIERRNRENEKDLKILKDRRKKRRINLKKGRWFV